MRTCRCGSRTFSEVRPAGRGRYVGKLITCTECGAVFDQETRDVIAASDYRKRAAQHVIDNLRNELEILGFTPDDAEAIVTTFGETAEIAIAPARTTELLEIVHVLLRVLRPIDAARWLRLAHPSLDNETPLALLCKGKVDRVRREAEYFVAFLARWHSS